MAGLSQLWKSVSHLPAPLTLNQRVKKKGQTVPPHEDHTLSTHYTLLTSEVCVWITFVSHSGSETNAAFPGTHSSRRKDQGWTSASTLLCDNT